jgi:signal transduction histidine kinase
MSLLARTRLVASLVTALALLLTGAFYVAHQRVLTARAAMDSLVDVWTEVAQLRTASIDFALQGNERARTQTAAKALRLHALLSEEWRATTISDRPDEEHRLRRRLHGTLLELEDQMSRLGGTSPSAALEERDNRTRYRLNLKGQELAAVVGALIRLLDSSVTDANRWMDTITFGLGGMLIGLTLLAITMIEHHIVRPLDQLRQAAETIQSGVVDREVAAKLLVDRNDEIGVLSKALAQMVKRLEDANKELESFSYSVSHDLRAPLRAIDGFSRKVGDRYGDKLDDEGRRLLQVVRDNAQRMGQLIDDLLAFSRMGRREIELQPVDMESMARSVAEELLGAEPQRAIEFSFAALPQTRGDAAMLRQVWMNLLGNALKFSRRRQDALIEVGGYVEAGEVFYWVKDNGAGFDMQYADKLFGVFQRLHRQDEFEGTGVGLATAQRIVHRHKGRIWGEGKPEAGATFWFTLPLPPGKPLSGGQSS